MLGIEDPQAAFLVGMLIGAVCAIVGALWSGA